jgi:hypothetical protein
LPLLNGIQLSLTGSVIMDLGFFSFSLGMVRWLHFNLYVRFLYGASKYLQVEGVVFLTESFSPVTIVMYNYECMLICQNNIRLMEQKRLNCVTVHLEISIYPFNSLENDFLFHIVLFFFCKRKTGLNRSISVLYCVTVATVGTFSLCTSV